MYIKRLRIINKDGIIRDVPFHQGLNLIVDNTPIVDRTETGNNVGKTTVLRLVDFCLGKDGKVVYSDPVDSHSIHTEVRDFLVNTKVVVELTLTQDWSHDDVVICRGFEKGRNATRTINGKSVSADDFESTLSMVLLGMEATKPSFRQIISHNIRYSDLSINHVLKTLHSYTKDTEYESLYLFMFGCKLDDSERRQAQMEKIKTERAFKKRLEKSNGKSAYVTLLGLANARIETLQSQKDQLNISPTFAEDLNKLNEVKSQINAVSAEIATLKLKQDTIREVQRELNEQHSDIDRQQLADIYHQAKSLMPNVQKTFEDLLSYHNSMVESRSRFVSIALPALERKIEERELALKSLLNQEKELTVAVTKSDTFDDLEQIITALNEEYAKKGEYENMIRQIEEVEESIAVAEAEMSGMDESLFSDSFQNFVQSNIDRFNVLFTSVSKQLYDEEFVLSVEAVNYRNTGRSIYKFSTFNANLSSGKKMGEISCFDIAYTMFARDNNVPHLSFLLNDKRELMSDNQLVAIARIVERENIQFVASILRDKLPPELQDSRYNIIELSSTDKLFKI